MLIGYKRGQTSVVLRVKILNSSVSTGAGLTGLTSGSTGLIISTIADNEASATAYTVAGSTIESITTLGTYATPTATKCRFKEVDSTNHPGVYEIQIADARFAVSSAKSLLVSISGATNAAQCDVVVPLRDLDPYDAVRAGLTAMPNVASGSAGAIITSGTGTAQLSTSSGQVLLQAGTGTGQLDFTSGVVKANLTQISGSAVSTSTAQLGVNVVNFGGSAGTFAAGRPEVNTTHIAGSAVSTSTAQIGVNVVNAGGTAWASGSLTSGVFAAGAINAAAIAADAIGASELAADAVSEIAAGVWDLATTGHTTAGTFGAAMNAAGSAGDPWATSLPGSYTGTQAGKMLSDAYAAVDTETSAASIRAALGLASANLDTQIATLATASALSTVAGYVDTEVAAIKAKTDNLPSSPAATGDAMTLTSAYDFAKGTVAPTESYRSANGVPTPIQALLELIAHMGECSISSTTKTLKKVDGSTTAKTFTLNSATTPTSITETT